ncbi:sugar transferase [Dactylosporangium matsuzakiense]|uniref:Sugar transferase n=1 Tax=Dactylosporangium matsuzakiense TaxID=53360 RepID=A0A9W6KAQ6_9ACTN|nr:sugar transferase [Dactylosporangium matsuzakiense]UWZ45366.1 sugar transferase [Dactylosporangium matsuzakiense]GLK98650.1 sugar transferase [Dactylosporangium matsuzakiense]
MRRPLDVVVASAAAVVLAPVIAATAVFVRLALGGPVLFRQERAGRNGEPFTLVKFRSMREGPGSDAERLTRAGRFLRSSSLDELPALWNVLRGDMSLIGPRPLPLTYLDRYTEEQRHRHDVRPGITGLAQVRGRNSLSWDQKFAYDLEYVRGQSLGLDLRILAETIRTVLRRDGISAEGAATAHEFEGGRR